MAWTEIATLTQGQVITHTILNQMNDNIEYLRQPNDAVSTIIGTVTTTSATLVSMGTDFEKTIVTYGGPVLVLLTGPVKVTGADVQGTFDIEVNSVLIGGAGISFFVGETNAGTFVNRPAYNCTIGYLIDGLSAGTYTFKMMWAVAATGTLQLGTGGVANRFIVREM